MSEPGCHAHGSACACELVRCSKTRPQPRVRTSAIYLRNDRGEGGCLSPIGGSGMKQRNDRKPRAPALAVCELRAISSFQFPDILTARRGPVFEAESEG